jgi:hypothetical protein
LPVSQFLIRIQEFCATTTAWVIKMMTDNQGLLTRITTSLQYPTPFPNLTLLPNWDITHEIAQSLRKLSHPPSLLHVKGHQDDDTQYCDLPLDAQLNVDADTEAGYYQSMYPAQRRVIPCMPSNAVQLHISGDVICSHVKSKIRAAFIAPAYLQHAEKRFQWSTLIYQSVDWQVYTRAISQFRTRRIQITKLCNKLLTTAHWAHRYNSLTTKHCLHCSHIEDRDHIIKCTFAPCQTWRNSLLS